jgi:septum formation protein
MPERIIDTGHGVPEDAPPMTPQLPLLLGSASPRRREILTVLGIAHLVAPQEVDETRLPGEAADAYLIRIVGMKRDRALTMFDVGKHAGVLVADTSVIVDGDVLGKPGDDAAEGRAMLTRLAGREHEVHTRFCVSTKAREISETVVTSVVFRSLTPARIERYVESGEGRDKAGGYAIQGLASGFVSEIRGSYTNVVGLPASNVLAALEQLGLA